MVLCQIDYIHSPHFVLCQLDFRNGPHFVLFQFNCRYGSNLCRLVCRHGPSFELCQLDYTCGPHVLLCQAVGMVHTLYYYNSGHLLGPYSRPVANWSKMKKDFITNTPGFYYRCSQTAGMVIHLYSRHGSHFTLCQLHYQHFALCHPSQTFRALPGNLGSLFCLF